MLAFYALVVAGGTTLVITADTAPTSQHEPEGPTLLDMNAVRGFSTSGDEKRFYLVTGAGDVFVRHGGKAQMPVWVGNIFNKKRFKEVP